MAHLLFLLAGLGGFVYLVHSFGPADVMRIAGRAGWSLLYVMLVWMFIYLLNTLAWRLVLGAAGAEIRFSRLLAVYVSGCALNTITPFLAVGGEPYRAGVLADTLGLPGSVSAVVLYRLVNLLAHLLLLATGILLGMALLPMGLSLRLALVAVCLALGGTGYWVHTIHRDGIFVPAIGWIRRLPVFHRAARMLDKHAAELATMDALFTDAYRHRRARFIAALSIEYLTRVMMGLEVYIIIRGAGVPVSFWAALFIYVIYSIIINVIFFIPLNLGIRESGLMLGLHGFAMAPLLGVYLGVVIRIREAAWVLLGLLLVLVTSTRKMINSREKLRP